MEEMKNFAEAIEETLKPLHMGDIVKGMVIGITPTEVQVDLGGKSDGVIPFGELSDDPNYKIEDDIKIGQEIEVFVFRVSDVEGIIGLSRKKIDSIKGFKEVEAALETKEILTGRVVEIVSSGVIVNCKGAEVFIPASQASDRYIEDLGVLLNAEVSFRVIDVAVRRGKKRIVGSIRAVAREVREAKSAEFWAAVEEGKKYTGTVKSVTDFGAFVDIGGVDGLVHVSELSWQKVKHPSDVVKVGDVLEVYIKSVDKEKGKISLGFKKMEDNPWVVAAKKLNVGDTISCKIVRIVPFGAFAEIMPHVDGLIHISQISWQHIAKPSDELSVGQQVQAKVLSVDPEIRQISLSIKELLDPPVIEAAPATEEAAEDAEPTGYTEESSFTIGDSLDNIIEAAEETAAEAVEEAVVVEEVIEELAENVAEAEVAAVEEEEAEAAPEE
ncbi:MAG: 30S ribosomal protein S1 [Oscillospiraceae bacterium]|nr:30S ribosomal protein S1 [Oscillospiraceae bacterium]